MGTNFKPSIHQAVAVPTHSYFDDMNEDFSMVDTDLFASLMRRYNATKKKLMEISAFMKEHSEETKLLDLFFRGNLEGRDARAISSFHYNRLFNTEGAIKALDANCWSEALALTKIMDLLPAKRRNEWNNNIYELNTPPFTEDNVRATFLEMFAQRKNYFAERVDGIFRALSHEHVTNRPEGFSKRLISYIRYSVILVSSDVAHIEDLRHVVATLLKREAPPGHSIAMYNLINDIYKTGRTGEWFDIDGGAFKIKVFLKGTVHIDIHPDIAWQLNRVLAHLYPQAIPSQFKTPKKQAKNIKIKPLLQPLPKSILLALHKINEKRPARSECTHYYGLPIGHFDDKFARERVIDTLTAIGGQASDNDVVWFDYDVSAVINEIVFSGVLPDAKSHQFYPTPEALGEYAASLLEVDLTDIALEPSAGTGRLAAFLPKGQTTCVEYASLHCDILRAKGFDDVHQADFLKWAPQHAGRFTKVLLNPPFTGGQAEAHLDAALTCLAPGGRLVAILPSGMASRWRPEKAQQATVKWMPTIHNAFPGVGVSVTIAIVEK